MPEFLKSLRIRRPALFIQAGFGGNKNFSIMNQVKTKKVARLCALYDHFIESSDIDAYKNMCRCEELAIHILCGTDRPSNAMWYYCQRHFIKAWKSYKYNGTITTVN